MTYKRKRKYMFGKKGRFLGRHLENLSGNLTKKELDSLDKVLGNESRYTGTTFFVDFPYIKKSVLTTPINLFLFLD